jgi:hypothetical protein
MGYSTYFNGQINIEPPLNDDQQEELNKLQINRHEGEGLPGIWCDWEVTDGSVLKHAGNEKFYNYTDWLKYLIDNYFNKYNVKLNGKLFWQGESIGDVGIISVENSVMQVKNLDLEKGEFVVVE